MHKTKGSIVNTEINYMDGDICTYKQKYRLTLDRFMDRKFDGYPAKEF